ncbi:MAG TPA: nitroreductase family deazaflavin-dependent oxidoreductase [Anaerolineae bacterium]|nr:nitroreductase family deazaflavin-dependent oxidoreductase [Anaerolineae bacterium]
MSHQTSSTNHVLQTKPGKANDKAPALMIPIFKLPVLLYRLHMGWLLGKRFMQIAHVGRRSGKVRRTILAVLRFDDKTKEIYAVSAWKGSDWYYNIQASPPLQVESGFVRYIPVQRTLSPEEITTTFMQYRKKHPIFSRMICRIPGWKWNATYEEFLELARTLHGVAFEPK